MTQSRPTSGLQACSSTSCSAVVSNHAGYLPFFDENIGNLYSKIIFGDLSIQPNINQQAAALLRKLLRTSPSERPSLEEILSHEWMAVRVLHAKFDCADEQEHRHYPAMAAAKRAVADRLHLDVHWRAVFKLESDASVKAAIDRNPSVQAYVRILANKMVARSEVEAFQSEDDESSNMGEKDFAPKVLSQRSNSNPLDPDEDYKFDLDEENLDNVDARDLSHGGYRDYSVSQGLQEELNASYVAFNDDGVPIKTFFHAKTFNGQHSRLKKKHTGHLGKEATGLVKQVSISTEEETPIKQFQSLRMMSLPVQETCERKATLMARVDEENSSVHESVLLAGRGRYEDAGLEAVEFNRESFKFVRLNKSLDPPSLKNNPKDIHLEALLSPS